ncbi:MULTISPECIES: ATP-binding cassette domain-containing protein [Micromonospora]|uniref:ATP-binding cassette domain-containing protein n=1 Tax=Micromonospora TaxID=1873 RepID=UPI00064BB1E9|nr:MULTISPECIES: ABC transporter ATP-binding protein [Micromonospora]MDG4750881.1 ABC transporter ATP-binding protein [Micromonospora sp. WMMD718]UFN96860.1 ABC transporter ATP-binding protein/permease [Micromonospora aurantiaca]
MTAIAAATRAWVTRASEAGVLLRTFWASAPGWTLVVGVLSLAVTAGPSVVLIAIGRVVAALPRASGAGWSSPEARGAWQAVALFLVAGFALSVLTGLLRIATAHLARAVQSASLLRLAMLGMGGDGIAHLEDPAVSAELLAAAEHHREGVFERSVDATVTLVTTRLTGLFAGAVLLSWHWWAPVVVLCALGLMASEVRRWFEVVYEMFTQAMGDERRQAGYLRDLLMTRPAAKEVRLFHWLPWMDDRINRVWTAAMRTVWAVRSQSLRTVLLGTYVLIAYGLVLGWLALDVRHGRVGAAAVAVYLQALLLMALFGEFGLQGYDMARASTALRLLNRLEQSPWAMAATAVADRPVAGSGPVAVAFDGVSFAYPGHDTVLHDVTVHIPAGQSVAVVGANGAGKSTLIRLVCGLSAPTAGQVELRRGGEVLSPGGHRVAAVFQRFGRYELGLRDNITLGNIDADPEPELVGEVLRAFGGLPGRDDIGGDTTLSSAYVGGTDLSGGQWQRVALARALFAVRSGASGLLVLDEPTAALDARSEAELFERLLDVVGDVTTLLVTHRLSAVRHVDRVLVLRDGVIVEDGSHESLLARDGYYAELFRTQAKRFRDEITAGEA